LFYPKGIRQNAKRQRFTHSGTITLDFNPVTVRLSGTATSGERDANAARSIFNIANDRYSTIDFFNGAFSGKITHVLSDNLFYELGGGFSYSGQETTDPYLGSNFWAYGDSVQNTNAGVTWDRTDKERAFFESQKFDSEQRRYWVPSAYNIFGYSFRKNGVVTNNYTKREAQTISGRFDLTYLPTKHHNIKFGGEFKQHTQRRWFTWGNQNNYASQLNQKMKEPGHGTVQEEKEKILYARGVSNYGYDIWGEKTDEAGFYAPHKPIEAGVYLQDKIEFDDIILNIGLRYDYFDMDNLTLKDPTRPELAISTESKSGKLNMDGFKEVAPFSSLSPRLSVSFPVTDRTVFHAGFGKFVQQAPLQEVYDGYHSFAYQVGQSNFFSNPNGSNLRPIRKTHYEVGFRQQLTDFMAFDVTGYYDDVKGQIYFAVIDVAPTSPYTSYNSKENGDFSTTKGVEIQLTMRRYNRLSGSASLSFQDARGTGSNPNSNSGIVGAPLDGVTVFRPSYVTPLTFNKPFTGNLFLDYRFGVDDGPALLDQFGVSLLATFSSGHPFTRGIGGEDIETDARFRQPIEPLNASLTPSNMNVDLKIDKTFSIFDNLGANIYFKVLNLFNTRNIDDVFIRSGAADDDGYLANPELGGKKIEKYGEVFNDIYKALNIEYNGFYGNARQILLGIRLEY